MPAPDVDIVRGSQTPVRAFPTDTGVAIVPVITRRGPLTPTEIRNMDEYEAVYGTRETDSFSYDWMTKFFASGGYLALCVRVVGTAPVKASKALSDGSATAVTVRAKEYGAAFSAFTIAVVLSAGSATYTLAGTTGAGDAFSEVYGPYATVADAIAADPSDYVEFVLGTGLDPVTAGAAALTTTTGTDDRASITVVTHYNAAYQLVTDEFGPGQIALPGITAAASHAVAQAFADSTDRVAVLDFPDSGTVATLTAVAATDNLATGAELSAGLAPWVEAPGVASSTVGAFPPSAFECGRLAANDARGVPVNRPSAGTRRGVLDHASGVSQDPWSKPNRDTLNDAGITVIRDIRGSTVIDGARSLADPDDLNWRWFSNARFFMKLAYELRAMAEDFKLDNITPQKITEFAGALEGVVLPYWPNDGLYGATPAEAFLVDVSGNNDTTAAAGELLASVGVKIAPNAEQVRINLVKVLPTATLAA